MTLSNDSCTAGDIPPIPVDRPDCDEDDIPGQLDCYHDKCTYGGVSLEQSDSLTKVFCALSARAPLSVTIVLTTGAIRDTGLGLY